MLTHFFEVFHQGGPVMYILVLCSLFAVTVAVERFLYYRRISSDLQGFQENLFSLLDKHRFTDAAQLCDRSTPNVLAAVASAGLDTYQRGGQLEPAVETAASTNAARLRERLDDLSMIVTLAPLLGLLGTVIGMIQSFSVLNVSKGQPLAITGGVGEALVATATGLIVATLALILYNLLSRRANSLITSIEQTAGTVLTSVTTTRPARRDAHEIA